LAPIAGFTDNEVYGGVGGTAYLGFFPFDDLGLGFVSGGVDWNIFYDSGSGGLAWFASFDGFETIAGTSTASASLTEAPLPAALPLFGTGLGAGGLIAVLRRKRKAAAVAAD